MSFLEAKVSRRTLLKGAAITPAALFVGAEVQKATTGVIHTPYADYYPFYESHEAGIEFSTRETPDPWDYHWREWYFELPDTTVSEELSFMVDQRRGGIENLRILAERGVKIATADIDAPTYTEGLSNLANKLRIFYTSEGTTWDPELHILGSAIFFVRWKNKLFQAALSKLTGINFANPGETPYIDQMIRRTEFLRRLVLTPLDIATGYLFINTLAGGVWHNIKPEKSDLPIGWEREQITSRALNRAQGLLTHTRPNDMIAFFRNLLWADKLSELAEIESQKLGRKLNISYQAGMGHGGFEDLLQLGRPFTSTILGCYSKDVWSDVVDKNGLDRIIHTTIVSATDPLRGADLTTWVHERDLRHNNLASLVTSKISG